MPCDMQWTTVLVDDICFFCQFAVPSHPSLNGTECYTITRDHLTGESMRCTGLICAIAFRYCLVKFAPTTGWKSQFSTHFPLHPTQALFRPHRTPLHNSSLNLLAAPPLLFHTYMHTYLATLTVSSCTLSLCILLSVTVGLANITIQFKVHSGWKSLVTVATIKGELSIARIRMFGSRKITLSVLSYRQDPIPIEV